MPRWRKNGGPSVAELPAYDQDAEGGVWTSLATNEEGRAACGWAEAGVPDQVGMAEARIALAEAGLLEEIDAWVASQGIEIQELWRRPTIRRNAPVLLSAAGARGMSADQLDQLFIRAEAIAAANNP